MDIVYVTGREGVWGFNELRFSVRSAEKHLKFDKLFLIGYKPKFFNDKAIHYLVPDNRGHKYKNVAHKIKFLIEQEDISDDFIFMNDDFFLLQDYETIPYYYNKTIKEWVDKYPFHKGRYYQEICKLYKDFPNGKFYEVHFPIVYNKKMVKDVIKKYNLEITLMLRSYYCNEYKVKPIEETKDYKIYNTTELSQQALANIPFVSCTNEIGANAEFKSFLLTKFPKKSLYEQ